MSRSFNQLHLRKTVAGLLVVAEVSLFDQHGTNVALLGTATASSEAYGGLASLAIDGSTDNTIASCHHSASGPAETWTLTLDRAYLQTELISVTILGRNVGSNHEDIAVELLSTDGQPPLELGTTVETPTQTFSIPPPLVVTWVLDANNKYEVSSRNHLIQIMHDGAIFTNTGDVPTPSGNQWGRADYIQTADIDLEGDSTNIRSMGFTSNWAGEYDGNGFTVSNWVYVEDNFPNPATTPFSGVFCAMNGGTVKNFRLAGVCSLSGFTLNTGFICDTAFNSSTLSNIEVDLSPGSFIAQSSTQTGVMSVGTIFGRLEFISMSTTGITFKGQIDSITVSDSASTVYAGGLVGWIRNSSGTNTLYRNLGTFPGGLTGNWVGGVFGLLTNSNMTKVLNAMTGDITNISSGDSYIGGVMGGLVQTSASFTNNEIVNSMTGNITGDSFAVGGVIGRHDQDPGSTVHSLFNYMTGDVTNTDNDSVGGIIADGDSNTNITTSINAMNGHVRYPTTGDTVTAGAEANIDTSFGLTFEEERNVTTTPLGLPTDSEVGLPIFDLSATDPDSVVLAFDFVFGNLPRNFNQLHIASAGSFIDMAELEILDMTGTNIALLGTASTNASLNASHAPRGNDGNTDPDFSSGTVTDLFLGTGGVTWTLDLDREYTLAEINKVIFYNRATSQERAIGTIITFLSNDGGDPEQVGVLTSDSIQEFVVTVAPEFLLPTAGVASISATVVEVTGALTYQITVTDVSAGTTRVSHTGISTGDVTIGALTPETTYVLHLFADTGSGYVLEDTETVTTLANSAENYDVSIYGSDGVFDLSVLDNSSFALLGKVLNDVFTTGDKLEINLGTTTSDVAFVKIGEAVSTDDSILVPFNTSGGSGQEITMNLSDTSMVSVAYDDVNNSLTIGTDVVQVGDSIVIDGKKLTVKEL